jgi:hypothetical protein
VLSATLAGVAKYCTHRALWKKYLLCPLRF